MAREVKFQLGAAGADGSIDFLGTSGNYYYVLDDAGINIGTPQEKIKWTSKGDGAEPVDSFLENRKVTIRFSIVAVDEGYLGDAIVNINRVLDRTTEFYKKLRRVNDPHLAVNIDPGGGWTSYFKPYSGQFFMPSQYMGVEGIHKTNEDGNILLTGCRIELICDPKISRLSLYSRGTALGTVPLTNYNGTDVTSGLKINNSYETSTYCNYVQIDGDDIEGDMSPPTILVFDATQAGDYISKVIVGHTTDVSHSSSDLTYEGEDATVFGWSSSTQTDSDASGGDYERITVDNAAYNTSDYVQWLLQNGLYGSFRVYAKTFTVPDAGIAMRNLVLPLTTWKPYTAIYGDDIITDGKTSLFDLGEISLPPRIARQESGLRSYLRIQAHYPAGGSKTLDLDSVFLLPVDDGYRVYNVSYPFFVQGGYDALVDDQWIRNVWTGNWPPANALSNVAPYFSPIELVPGKDQRLYFIFLEAEYAESPSWYRCYRTLEGSIILKYTPSFKHLVT